MIIPDQVSSNFNECSEREELSSRLGHFEDEQEESKVESEMFQFDEVKIADFV